MVAIAAVIIWVFSWDKIGGTNQANILVIFAGGIVAILGGVVNQLFQMWRRWAEEKEKLRRDAQEIVWRIIKPVEKDSQPLKKTEVSERVKS